MSCNCNFKDTLHYVSPAHGGWGLVRIAALIPQSHQLFVAPFACGRHGALGGALNGMKDKISYLYIDESDIVSGGYEDLIPDAVAELLDSLENRPKVIMIFVTCLDDLLGTDHVQLNQRLSEQHPDVKFMTCHMNPISENMKFPPGISMQNNLYSLLERNDEKINSVNFIGNHTHVQDGCELYQIMEDNGYKLKHITDFETFEEYQSMAQSKLNLVLSPVAKYASEQMEKNLGIKSLLAYNTYDLQEIRQFYEQLAEKLASKNTDELEGEISEETTDEISEEITKEILEEIIDENGKESLEKGVKDFQKINSFHIDITPYENRAKEKIAQARELIGNHPIAIDYQAVRKPFTLAKALIEYGFHVKMVMVDAVKKIEKSAYEYIVVHHPEVTIVNGIHPEMIKQEYRNEDNYICIGFDCGYATGSSKVINVMQDEGWFGYYGVEQLMESMMNVFENGTDVKEMIEEAHLII